MRTRSAIAGMIAVLSLAVGGCTLNDAQRDEVSEIASAEAADAVSDSQKVQELEDRIADLEDRLDRQGVPY